MDDRLTIAHQGFDGTSIVAGDRVELHPGLDLWARGARFGDVVKVSKRGIASVHVDRLGRVVRIPASRLRVAII